MGLNMNETSNVYQRLNIARNKFHAMPIKKSGWHDYGKYGYFELGDFIIPALNIFEEVGLCSIITFGKEMAEMRIINIHKVEEVIVIQSPMSSATLKGCHEVQNLGAVQTYLRRYLWCAALEIVEHDLLDATTKKLAPIIPASPRTEDLNLDPDVILFIEELAAGVKELVQTNPEAALNMIYASGLDGDQAIALNNMLDSKTRTALKKVKETKNAV